jgi:hypothetical protein
MPNLLLNDDRIDHGGSFLTLAKLLFFALTAMIAIALGLMVVWVTLHF